MIERRKCQVPADAITALARRLYPAMVAFFDTEEGRQEFAEWQARQAAENSKDQSDKCSA